MDFAVKEAIVIRHEDYYLGLKALAQYSSLSARKLRELIQRPINPLPRADLDLVAPLIEKKFGIKKRTLLQEVARAKKGEKSRKKINIVCGGNFRDTLQNFLTSIDKTGGKVSFHDVLLHAEKFLYVTPDTEYALKIGCASVVANFFEDDPLWMLIVAPPSSAKTETIQCLGGNPFAWNISCFTSKTLASGERNNPQASLLTRIGAFGLIFLKDLTTVLELNAIERAEIFSQLREVYDGRYFKTFGNGVVIDWKGKIGIIGACTPIIEKYGEAFKVLGERFLMCRISDVTTGNEELALNKALESQYDSINSLRDSLKALVARFLQSCLATALEQKITLTQQQLEIVKTCAKFIAKTRAVVVRDSYNREDILVKPFQEAPMRVAKQMKSLLEGLCVVDDTLSPGNNHLYYLFRITLDNVLSLKKEFIEAVPEEGIFVTDLARKLGYNEKSRYFWRLIEDLTKLGILIRKKESNRVSVFPSDVIKNFYTLYRPFCLESSGGNDRYPEKCPPIDSNNIANFNIEYQECWQRFEIREKDNPNLPFWVYLSEHGHRCHCKEWQGEKHCKHIKAVLRWKNLNTNG